MFSQREVAQPKLPISPKTRIKLTMEDPRTEEEKERDLLYGEIAQHTYPLLGTG